MRLVLGVHGSFHHSSMHVYVHHSAYTHIPGGGCELLTCCGQLMLSPFSDPNSLLPSILPLSFSLSLSFFSFLLSLPSFSPFLPPSLPPPLLPFLLSQYSRLHACVESAGARSQLATSHSSTSLQSLVTDQSIVLAVDSDVMAQLKTEEQSWVEEVSDFLRRYVYLC